MSLELCVCVCGGGCVCVLVRWNGMHVYRVAERGWVAACRDDGIGKRSLSLRPTAKPAGDAAAISSLSPSLRLPLSLSTSARSHFLSHFRVCSFHLFLVIFSLSPLLAPRSPPPDVFSPRFLSVWFSFVFISPPVAFCFLAVA